MKKVRRVLYDAIQRMGGNIIYYADDLLNLDIFEMFKCHNTVKGMYLYACILQAKRGKTKTYDNVDDVFKR